LYEAIQRLENAGYVEETSAKDDPENGQLAQRRYYRLTPDGWKVLRTELRHLARLVDHAQAHRRLRRVDPA
jgi:DNA-binding PadR family transcriptional regulator